MSHVPPNKVRYFTIPGLGADKVALEGTWADVLEAIPYFLMPGGPIPPRELVNEALKLGVLDAGMSGGCEWDATELDEESYNGVVHELLARPPRHIAFGGGQLEDVGSYKQLAAPAWVRTQSDFTFWSVEIARGVPGLAHRELSHRIDDLDGDCDCRQDRWHNRLTRPRSRPAFPRRAEACRLPCRPTP